ncbi:hypothetical protein EIP86_009805 [Pleurotus ostreatoroseus]|nr:hypothetical protein EIP86_009805 [Pleurotus ostreatoroseus]
MTTLPPSLKKFEAVATYKNTHVPLLLEQPIDHARKLRVVVVGAGFSGIATAYKLATEVENVDVVIYEKNEDVGGTCPSHCYQYTFAENTQWSKFYVPGSEILAYLRDCATKFQIRDIIEFDHEVVKTQWSEESGRWTLTLRQTKTGTEVEDNADIVISAMGFLNHWDLPNIEGLDAFKRKIVHTASWTLEPTGEAWRERTVAVIGCGSSAMQVVPALQPHVKQLDSYVRGQIWVSRPFVSPILSRYSDADTGNHMFTEEEKQLYKTSPEAYKAFRLELEDALNSVAAIGHEGSRLQEVLRNLCEEKMRQKLSSRPDIADGLIPNFPLSCRRLTPDGGYLDALLAPNVDFIKSEIRRFTEEGIETVTGECKQYDVIVCATGFDTSFIPRFPILGRNDLNLQDIWADYPKTYLGLCQDGFPNWYAIRISSKFQIAGPNSTINLGSFMPVIEKQIDYVLSCVRKMQRQRIKSMTVKKEAVEDFQNYCDAYFPRTVFARNCRNWYKKGKADARIIGLWPGSSLHQLRTLEQPRFEDFTYTYVDDNLSGSCLYWLGNGSTVAEEEGKPLTRAWYLT